MLELSWIEIGVILLVAVIVVGPKELPVILRKLGRWSRMARMQTQDILAAIEASGQDEDDDVPPHTVYDEQGTAYPAYDVQELLNDKPPSRTR